MSKPTTDQVKDAFNHRRPLATTNLVSNGTSLLSYGWYEIARWVYPSRDPNCCPAVQNCHCTPTTPTLVLRSNPKRRPSEPNGPWYSMTTAHHAGGVYNAIEGTPAEYASTPTPTNQGEMNL